MSAPASLVARLLERGYEVVDSVHRVKSGSTYIGPFFGKVPNAVVIIHDCFYRSVVDVNSHDVLLDHQVRFPISWLQKQIDDGLVLNFKGTIPLPQDQELEVQG